MTAIEDLMRVALVADEARKSAALRVLRGEADAVEPGAAQQRRPVSGPLLLNMGQAAALLNVSRTTLWRLIQDGRLPKVEIRRDSFRIRREDLEALVEGRLGEGVRGEGLGVRGRRPFRENGPTAERRIQGAEG